MKTESGQDSSMENREKERDRRGRGARGSRFSDVDNNSGGGGGGSGSVNRDRSRERRNCRVYISNIPYDYRWQDLKDLFRRIVGSVEYVELFHDENGKARGCGIVEFKDPDNVEKALEKMNRYEINGRELVVKEDHGEQRDQYGRIIRDGSGNNMMGGGGGGGGGGRDGMRGDNMSDRDRSYSRRDDDRLSGRNNFNMMSNDYNSSSNYNLYGLSASFLESLGINGPLHNKVFVANLDYKVDSKKLKQVFKLAGKVQSVDLSVDKEGNSRGFAVIEYDHPVEAVQAISMLDRQMLYDRRMTVRLDRIPDKSEGLKLPEGLGGVGIGLGPNGEPLKDVARNLPSMVNQQNPPMMVSGGNSGLSLGGGGGGAGDGPIVAPPQVMGTSSQHTNPNILGNLVANMAGGGSGGGVGGRVGGNSNNVGSSGGMFGNANVQPSPVAPVVQAATAAVKPQGGSGSNTSLGNLNLNNLSSSNLAALSNVVGFSAALSNNPLFTSSLNSLGLNLGSGTGGSGGSGGLSSGGNNDDQLQMGSTNAAALSNNYSTGGNNYSSSYGPMSGFNTNSGNGGSGSNTGSGSGVGSNFNAYNSSSGNGSGQSGSGGVLGGGSISGGNDNDYNSGNDMYGSVGSGGNMRKSDTIVIRNIPLSCTWQTLRDKFRNVGEVKYAEIRGNDLGVVRFFKERDAELAIASMDGSRIDGRTIKVTYY